MGVAENISQIKESLPEHVTLVAVSKTKPNEMIMEGYETGHLDYGENKAISSEDCKSTAARMDHRPAFYPVPPG